MKDCGCGGGKKCITKVAAFRKAHPEKKATIKAINAWVKSEEGKLDCGCGCKGKKGFARKYLTGGGLLPCPDGWRNDGLTCVEPCKAGERDDGLTCRSQCPEGWIDDGLTCRKPLTSSIDPCPDGSKDVAGTCWGSVGRSCVDDCFNHPAPGCKTWECGRLLGAFGEDWGPKYCTDCNLRCGQTCWDTPGITKGLAERHLHVFGGEVVGQTIRSKNISLRIDFIALQHDLEKGLSTVLGTNVDLGKLFDPNKNGVADAFRKFGEETDAAFKAIGENMRVGFEKMGADAAAAFKKFGDEANSAISNFLGPEIMTKLKDPYFWVDFVTILAQVASVMLSVAIIAGTLGAGTGLAIGLGMALNMVGPAMKIIADASTGKPIDALDIASLALSCIPPVPGAGVAINQGLKQAIQVANYAKTAGTLIVSAVKVAQSFDLVPSTCLGPNCPAKEEFDIAESKEPPPPAGQLTDLQILELMPPEWAEPRTLGHWYDKPPVPNPKFLGTGDDWIAKYRKEHYNVTPAPAPAAAASTTNIENEPGYAAPPDFGMEDEPGYAPPPIFDDEEPDTSSPYYAAPPVFDDEEPDTSSPYYAAPPIFDEEPDVAAVGAGRRRFGGDLTAQKVGDREYSNPYTGELALIPAEELPKTADGFEFDPACYANNYPELATSLGGDLQKLSKYWKDIGFARGDDAGCGNFVPPGALEKRLAKLKAREINCKATDGFWTGDVCDSTRRANGSENAEAVKCKKSNSYWDGNYCNILQNEVGEPKSLKDKCSLRGSYYYNDNDCDLTKNVDGTQKTEADICSSFNNFWDSETRTCDIKRDVFGSPRTEKDLCEYYNNYWDGSCDVTKNVKGKTKSERDMCYDVDSGNYQIDGTCPNKKPRFPVTYAEMIKALKDNSADEFVVRATNIANKKAAAAAALAKKADDDRIAGELKAAKKEADRLALEKQLHDEAVALQAKKEAITPSIACSLPGYRLKEFSNEQISAQEYQMARPFTAKELNAKLFQYNDVMKLTNYDSKGMVLHFNILKTGEVLPEYYYLVLKPSDAGYSQNPPVLRDANMDAIRNSSGQPIWKDFTEIYDCPLSGGKKQRKNKRY